MATLIRESILGWVSMCFRTSSSVVHPASRALRPPCFSRTRSSFETNAQTKTCRTASGGRRRADRGTIMCFVARSPSTAETTTDTAARPRMVLRMYGEVLLARTSSLPLLQSFSRIAAPMTANLRELSDVAGRGGTTDFAASTSDIGTRMNLIGPGAGFTGECIGGPPPRRPRAGTSCTVRRQGCA